MRSIWLRWPVPALVMLLSACVSVGGAPGPDQADLRTVAERSDYRQTAAYEDVVALARALDAASDRVVVGQIGRTLEDREIPVVWVADPPVASPEQARASGKPVVVLIGNIHAGEVCGKEALLMLARDLALSDPQDPVLDALVLAVVPIFNADGNERMAPGNRPGQNGPDAMGIRENASGLDLNRDFTKLEAPETRALVRLIDRSNAALIIDTHTTNGSFHRYTLTYDTPIHPAGDPAVIDWCEDALLPHVSKTVDERHGWKTFFYGNFDPDHTRWDTFPAQPRFGTRYAGLRNRPAVLTEAYAYAPFKDRVLATRDFVRACLEYTAEHADELQRLVREADDRTTAAGQKPGPENTVALRVELAPTGPATIAGWEEEHDGERTVATDRPKDYVVEHRRTAVSVASVTRPAAYVLPADLTNVVELLQRHGVRVDELREDLDLDVELYTLDALARSPIEFQGHRLSTLSVTARTASRRLPAGSFVVRTAQPLGTLACYLLEPQSEDGVAAWNLLDDRLQLQGEYPILRLAEPLPLLTLPADVLPEDRRTGQALTFEALYASDPAPNFSGSPTGVSGWNDEGTHFYQTKEDRLWRVEAATGRAAPAWDTALVAGALRGLDTFDEDTATSIAERASLTLDKARTRALVSHEGDLYAVMLDGSRAVRLTSSPAREDLATFSPDGRFVAFVRDHDLWVVDVASATERALTTGGSDTLRRGEADWVYYEEVFGRDWRTFWWSPDSRTLAFLETDSTGVPEFTIVDDVPEPQAVERQRYPKPGQTNPRVRLGLVSAAGGPVRWPDLGPYDPGAFLITGVSWWKDSGDVCVYVQDRVQTWLDVRRVPARGGPSTLLFRETTGAWVTAPPAPEFLDDGSFVFLSERTGWQHAYRYARDGTLLHALTDGEWDVRAVEGVDPAAGSLYVSGTRDDPLATNLYRVALDATGTDRLTHEPGAHRASVAPRGGLFVDTWSSPDRPAQVMLRDGAGAPVRTLDTNPVRAVREYRLLPLEWLSIPTPDAGSMQALLIRPPGFDPARTYPVWMTTYAGPQAPTISRSWAGGRTWDRLLAEHGLVVLRVDPRAASGRGVKPAWGSYLRLGEPELEDLKAAAAWVAQQPWADASRLGLSGHSFGGFITALAMTKTSLFAAGVAGAPVTDWRDYDSIYTERFMRTPQDNPAGYDATSPRTHAQHLSGRLLLAHGTLDDNVHLQNTIRFLKAAQAAGGQVELLLVPGQRHGLSGRAYQRAVLDFILRTLRPEPPEPPTPAGGASEADEAARPGDPPASAG